MKTLDRVGISAIAGIAVGAFGLQALHAQAKPLAYVVRSSDRHQ